MAQFILNGTIYQLADNTPLKETCRQAGVPFNCYTGVCASCLISISEGAELLSPLTSEEQSLGLDRQRRLACQCIITGGTVKAVF